MNGLKATLGARNAVKLDHVVSSDSPICEYLILLLHPAAQIAVSLLTALWSCFSSRMFLLCALLLDFSAKQVFSSSWFSGVLAGCGVSSDL